MHDMHDRVPAANPFDQRSRNLDLSATPQGTLRLDSHDEEAHAVDPVVAKRLSEAFARSPGAGLIHLGSAELDTELPASLTFGREIAKLFFSRVCSLADLESRHEIDVPAPDEDEL